MKFTVRLDGVGVVSGTIDIEARNKQEAEELAMSRAADVVWHYNKLSSINKASALPKT